MSNKTIDAAYLKNELEKLAGTYDLPSITVWKQGRFIDSPRYAHDSQEWKDNANRYEKTLIRPYGGTNNALFRVDQSEYPSDITEYLQQVGELLERLTES